jgi:alpha-L-fucosidase 2
MISTARISRWLTVTGAPVLWTWGVAWAAPDYAPPMRAEAERIVSQYKTVMEAPPRKVPSRDSVDGPLLGNGNLGAVISGAPETQRFWLSKNNFWRLKDGHREGGPRLFGDLAINIPALAGATYRIEQEIFPAITTSRFTKDASTVTMRSWVAASADYLIVELAVEGKPVEVDTRFTTAPGRGSKEALGRKDGVLWATKAFAEEVKIPTAAACALTVIGGQPIHPELEPVVEEPIPDPPPKRPPPRKAQSQPGPKFTLQPGRKMAVVVAMRSSFDAEDPLAAALAMAHESNAAMVATLEEKHREWWRAFWERSLVEISDPLLEQNYYVANYAIASALRDPEFPTGLFGLWVTSDDPRWAGDYHLNFDYQSQFYALYKSNHLEQARTYHAPILAFMERGRFYAKTLLNVRGVYYCVGIGAKGIDTCRKGDLTNNAYQAGGCFMGQKCNAAYSVVPMSMHWYHTYDKDYAGTVYPFVLEVANFWEDYLKFEDGRYVIYNDAIHEAPDVKTVDGMRDFNPVMSLGLVRNVFETVIDMGRELGVDAGRHRKWQDILNHLSDFPTQERNGRTVFRYTEKGLDWFPNNSCGIQHIYPSGAIGLDSDPKLLEISRNMISEMGRWSGDNGENSFYPAAVRVGYDPATILDKLTTLVTTTRKYPNGMPETIEQASTVPETINEMLCMSHRQVLRVFPVWPRTRDARFLDLRAEGAFLVSSTLKDGAVKYVRITSEQGRPCTLVNPWPGKAVDVYHNGSRIDTLKGERVVLKTQAGATFVLGPEGAGVPVIE